MSPVAPSWGADVYGNPEPRRLRGVLWRRVFAYFVDVTIIAGLYALVSILMSPLWIISFGTLSAPIAVTLALIPLAYHSLLISGRHSATWGQRLFDLEIRRLDGGRPGLLQAAVQTVMFYVTVCITTCLILLIAVFNRRRRTLHDLLAGTITLRRTDGPELFPPDSRP